MRAGAKRGAAVVVAATWLALAACAQGMPQGAHPGGAAVSSTGFLSGELLGLVTDAGGRPEAQAVVEVRASGLHRPGVHLLTGADGIFRLVGLAPGVYYVQVGKGGRIAPRMRVEVHASERALLLVNLPQILQSARWGAPPGTAVDQSFNWALRQSTIWRPVLRLEASTGDDAAEDTIPVQGYVAMTAGAEASAFDGPDLATVFQVDSSLMGAQVTLSGALGTNGQGGGEDTSMQAAFHSSAAGDPGQLTVGMRQISLPGLPGLPSLRMATVNYVNALELGTRLEVQYGALLNAASLGNTVATLDPYVRAQYRLGPQTQLEYRAISAVPPVLFSSEGAETPDPEPAVTLDNGRDQLEQAQHQELSYADSLTANSSLSVAVFEESFSGAAVNGAFSLNGAAAMAAEVDSGNLLPDLLNNMFLADGGDYGGWGYRADWTQHLGEHWQGMLGFSDGVALAPNHAPFTAGSGLAGGLAPARAESITAKISGVLPGSQTKLVCSYRAMSRATATELDPYDDGPGASGAYANISVRQPLPSIMGGGAGKVAALVEVQNLLAQGYIPMLGSDGQTLYLMQAARALRGGLTFSF